jgi:hypothetical protein
MKLEHFWQTTYNDHHHHLSSWIPTVMVPYSTMGNKDPQVSGFCCHTGTNRGHTPEKARQKSQCNKYKNEDSDLKHSTSNQQ